MLVASVLVKFVTIEATYTQHLMETVSNANIHNSRVGIGDCPIYTFAVNYCDMFGTKVGVK